ncbi:MAG: SCP2 sterol-binding domain-containing protein [Thermodesulfobacteriota bacterium]
MTSEGKNSLIESFFNLVRIPLRFTPLLIEAVFASVFISEIFDKHPRLKERLKELDGKVFEFSATDLNKRFYLTFENTETKVFPYFAGKPDVIMRGEAKTLLYLLLGKEDPDTVFFSRRLEINGDTAAAILLKNILASL